MAPLTITSINQRLGQIGGGVKRYRVATYACVAAVMLPLLSFAYSSIAAHTYSAAVHISVFTGGSDPLVKSTPITGPQLNADLAALKSVQLAEGAVQRLPGPAPRDRASLLRASAELSRQVAVGIGPDSRTLEVTAKASTPGRAAVIANAFAGAFLQFRGAGAQNMASKALEAGFSRIARLPPSGPARAAAIVALRRRLVPVLAERQIQVVQPAESTTSPLIATAVTAAIAMLALLALLALTGVWRLRPSRLAMSGASEALRWR